MKKPRTGRFLGIPYDWRRPSLKRARSRAWDVDEPRILVPKSYGWGWSVNFAAFTRPFRK